MENNKNKDIEKEESGIQPDPETLNTTDPQENMQGPFSSTLNSVKESVEDLNADTTKGEADAKKEEKM